MASEVPALVPFGYRFASARHYLPQLGFLGNRNVAEDTDFVFSREPNGEAKAKACCPHGFRNRRRIQTNSALWFHQIHFPKRYEALSRYHLQFGRPSFAKSHFAAADDGLVPWFT